MICRSAFLFFSPTSFFSVLRTRLYGLSHFSLAGIFLSTGTYNYMDSRAMFTPLNTSPCYFSSFSLPSNPEITQPFPLLGHDIDDYRTTVMHLENYRRK